MLPAILPESSRKRVLIEYALNAQEQDHRLDGHTELSGKTHVESNPKEFIYHGELPSGIHALQRTESWDFGPGEPYITFEDVLDVDKLIFCLYHTFGPDISIEKMENGQEAPFYVKNKDGRTVCAFWENFDYNKGRMNYFTDAVNLNGENEMLIETLHNYLTLPEPK